MEEIYWITRLDGLHTFLHMMILITLCLFVSGIAYWIFAEDFKISIKTIMHKWVLPCFLTLFILILSLILVPTTKEALVIYGVGETIDYIQENPTAKQLPDEVVLVLDQFVNKYLQEEPKQHE